MTKPVLRRMHSPDVADLATFAPGDSAFGLLVQLLVGPDNGPGEESFDIVVCTPEWLRTQGRAVVGLHHGIVPAYDYAGMRTLVDDFLDTCEGNDWHEVACKVARLGHWEFDDYRP